MVASLARLIGFLTMAAGAVGILLLAGGFLWFVAHVPAEEATLDRKADGIVVLTGAASRIPDAIELLAEQRGQRLLITGVHRSTSAREIARLMPLYSQYFGCCIDLDRSAINTFGNATETRRWAREHNFNSLIVVTSNWHMPRAMAELAHQLPEVTLIPFPVLSEKIKKESWWNGEIIRLLMSEYMKYIVAVLRLRLDPDSST
jgi:uncharacterized SAM-binding protein YcdF (DUF218 family)